jgi:cytochrome d ubiquinol oxidase subunit I
MSVTLILFILLYTGVFGTGIRYILQLIARGPEPLDGHDAGPETGRPARPLSAVPDRLDPSIILGSDGR